MCSSNLDLQRTAVLFAEPRLHPARLDSDYGLGLGGTSFYVVDGQSAPVWQALVGAGGCLLDHVHQPQYWPDGRGRIHGEGFHAALHQLLRENSALTKQFHAAATVTLPDGATVTVYARDGEASLEQTRAWLSWIRDQLPGSASWAELGVDTAERLSRAGRAAEACELWNWVRETKPYRGLVECPRLGTDTCGQARFAALAAQRWSSNGCRAPGR